MWVYCMLTFVLRKCHNIVHIKLMFTECQSNKLNQQLSGSVEVESIILPECIAFCWLFMRLTLLACRHNKIGGSTIARMQFKVVAWKKFLWIELQIYYENNCIMETNVNKIGKSVPWQRVFENSQFMSEILIHKSSLERAVEVWRAEKALVKFLVINCRS